MITRDLKWGIGHHTRALSKELLRLGLNVTIFTSNDGGLFTNPNLRVNAIPFLKKKTLKNCDLIHVQGSPYGAFLLNSEKPIVTTVHTTLLSELRFKKRIDYVVGVLFEFMTLQNSDALIAINDNIASELKKLYKVRNKTISIIPNGVDLNVFDAAKHKGQSEKIRILSGGRLEKRKGFDTLIKAMKIISEQYSNVELIIFGDGSERNRLIKQIEHLGLSNKVKLTGFLKRKELIKLYHSSDIFVCASFYEGNPLTLLDAMAAGLAIISSKIPSVRNLIIDKETGLLFDAGDSPDLASKLSELIGNTDLRRRLMLNARKHIEQRPNWEQVAKDTIKIYEQMLK